MHEIGTIVLSDLQYHSAPFPYFTSAKVFENGETSSIFNWLESTDLWEFTKAEFYTQYEICLSAITMPEDLLFLTSKPTIEFLIGKFKETFSIETLKLVDITAHKLTNGHRMGVHNDLIGPGETHRLVIQINPGWQKENGGFLMLFATEDPKDVSSIIQPLNNTAVGFEISAKSFHAVSQIHNYKRYTIVYTFTRN